MTVLSRVVGCCPVLSVRHISTLVAVVAAAWCAAAGMFALSAPVAQAHNPKTSYHYLQWYSAFNMILGAKKRLAQNSNLSYAGASRCSRQSWDVIKCRIFASDQPTRYTERRPNMRGDPSATQISLWLPPRSGRVCYANLKMSITHKRVLVNSWTLRWRYSGVKCIR